MADEVKQADEFEGGLVPTTPTVQPVEDTTPKTKVEFTPRAAAKATELLEQAADGNPDVEAVKALINQAMAARDAEIGALRAELEAVKTARPDGLFSDDASVGGFPWMYWKKPSNWPTEGERGWISYGPGGPSTNGNRDTGSFNRYLKKGLIPVTRYGYIEPPKTPNAIDSFLPILRKGGASEFPASQVIAYNWHINPPIPGLTFPQYEAVKGSIISFVCEACGHTLFFMPGEQAVAGETYRAHLMTSHKYPFREAAEAVKAAGLSIVSFRQPADVSAGAPATV